jgi:2-polyprenyl-6-hydroxyphenyl methylase/3-demethylubiquinone-9 3-methyltransferase
MLNNCKVCGAFSIEIGKLDINKCCIDRLGARFLPVSEILIPYLACPNCGFIYTTYMDNWEPDDFKTKIYNAEYEHLNPPIPGRTNVPLHERPSYLKGIHIGQFFQDSKKHLKILDFGAGGNPGPTGQALIDLGFSVDSIEPYRADTYDTFEKYGLIIAIEVLEHCHDLEAIKSFMQAHLADDGLIWIETLLHPFPTPANILSSWYIAPRDGHISIHTFTSLTKLFNVAGLNVVSNLFGTFAFKNLPRFANKIFV